MATADDIAETLEDYDGKSHDPLDGDWFSGADVEEDDYSEDSLS